MKLNYLYLCIGKACDLIDQHVTSSSVASIQSPSHVQQQAPLHFQTAGNLIQTQTMESIKLEPATNDARTRTPSPTSNPANYILQHDHLAELRKPPPLEKRDSRIKLSRSYSASHTPRPSIGSINDLPPLPPYPSDYNDDSKLLPANSLVSILSVNFNEEMIANNEQMESEQPSIKKMTRKHSLGSNLAESEDVLSAQPKSEEDTAIATTTSHIKLEAIDVIEQDPEDDNNLNLSYCGSPESDSVLEQTTLELEKLILMEEANETQRDQDLEKVVGGISSSEHNTNSSGEVRHRVKKKSFTGWFKDLGSSSKVNENNSEKS